MKLHVTREVFVAGKILYYSFYILYTTFGVVYIEYRYMLRRNVFLISLGGKYITLYSGFGAVRYRALGFHSRQHFPVIDYINYCFFVKKGDLVD